MRFNVGEYIVYNPTNSNTLRGDSDKFKPGRVQEVIDITYVDNGFKVSTKFLDTNEVFVFWVGSTYYDNCVVINIEDIQVGDIIANIGKHNNSGIDKFMVVLSHNDCYFRVQGLRNNIYDTFADDSCFRFDKCVVVFRDLSMVGISNYGNGIPVEWEDEV